MMDAVDAARWITIEFVMKIVDEEERTRILCVCVCVAIRRNDYYHRVIDTCLVPATSSPLCSTFFKETERIKVCQVDSKSL